MYSTLASWPCPSFLSLCHLLDLAAISGVVTWQASVCVAFVGFNTWPVMPLCWQPLSHDSAPSGTILPHSSLQAQRSPESLWAAPSSFNHFSSLHTPPCTHNRPRSFRHEACPPAPQILGSKRSFLSLSSSSISHHVLYCYRSLNLVLTLLNCV